MRLKFINGHKTNNQGGVLLVVISLLLIFSTIFIYQITSYDFNNRLNVNLQEFYQGEILRVATTTKVLAQYPQLDTEEVKRGTEIYNLGRVDYELSQDRLELVIELTRGKKTKRTIFLKNQRAKLKSRLIFQNIIFSSS